jgi:hypothetical protein
MKAEVFERRFPKREVQVYGAKVGCVSKLFQAEPDMGLAPGGRMRQEIYEDPYSIHDWDLEHGSRCFVHLVNAEAWKAMTGEEAPSQPLTPREYTKAGFPWFDYYNADLKALKGSEQLAKLKSVREKKEQSRTEPLAENGSVSVTSVVKVRPGRKAEQVREEDFWI